MNQYRTHHCGELSLSQKDQTVALSGWVGARRDHGGLIFIDLRDRYGITQVVVNPESAKKAHDLAQTLKPESVIRIQGTVSPRPESMINNKMVTGSIEILVQELELLSASGVLPFQIEDEVDTSELNRLKHRYLDLRRQPLQKNLLLRHKLNHTIRTFLDEQSFMEVETPYLTKSTPEGARDYVVPSRVHPGSFFALPQSPQLFKQLLMIAGFDKYYQIVRCFRDEDLRSDRQPEFTQLDMEMSFTSMSEIQALIENLMTRIMKELLDVDITAPFTRMSYQEAMQTYASDKPDLRYPIALVEISDVLANSSFRVFEQVIASQGEIRAMVLPDGASLSRSQIDQYTKRVQSFGAKGLIWIKQEDGKRTFSIEKFLSDEEKQGIATKLSLKDGDLALIVADQAGIARTALTEIKAELLDKLNFQPTTDWAFTWIENFPLFEFDAASQQYTSIHHPFTQPHPEDVENLLNKKNISSIRSNAYDLVLNGFEIGGGSIRIHQADVQEAVFSILGLNDDQTKEKFGFFLDALSYGTPPHGGIAFGIDRIAMLLAGCTSLRDVIAFPKTQNAADVMVDAPSPIDIEQLIELHVSVQKPKS